MLSLTIIAALPGNHRGKVMENECLAMSFIFYVFCAMTGNAITDVGNIVNDDSDGDFSRICSFTF